jgi:hypothetical protein
MEVREGFLGILSLGLWGWNVDCVFLLCFVVGA